MNEVVPFDENADENGDESAVDIPFDPSTLGFPVMLPIELALREHSVRYICESYEPPISREQFEKICQNPVFQKAYEDAQKQLQIEGMSYRLKARMQAEQLLKTSWALIHSEHTPPAVKADLIKHTAKVAGLEPQPNTTVGGAIVPLQINILMGESK